MTGTNKANGSFNEEGWTVLPNGNVLTVDVGSFQGQTSEIYSPPPSGLWSSGGLTGATLTTCVVGTISACEMGPQLLRPDGTLFAFGGVNEGTDPTAIYNTGTATWALGPNIPSIASIPYTLADAPGAVEPSGTILFAASPSNWTAASGAGSYPMPTAPARLLSGILQC